jgi:hypothetical protein
MSSVLYYHLIKKIIPGFFCPFFSIMDFLLKIIKNLMMPALELVTLVDEEEQQPVSSRTRSRKKKTLLM